MPIRMLDSPRPFTLAHPEPVSDGVTLCGPREVGEAVSGLRGEVGVGCLSRGVGWSMQLRYKTTRVPWCDVCF